MFGVCVADELKECNYKCVCQPGYQGEMCDKVVDDAKLNCNFERFEKCFFDNIQEGDDFEWGPGFKHSVSLGTGPEGAHRGSQFLFTEMSFPRFPGDKAILRTTVPLPDAITPDDCFVFGKEKEYNRTRSYTKKGIKCQAWNVSEPHLVASKYAHFESNYCRMGDAADPRCYTTDANTTWDWCGVPYCYASECSYASDGSDYVGTESHTATGRPCQMWDSNTPHKHRYNMLTKDRNYCRNPDSSVAPWCLTMDPAVRLGYCDVPRCERVEQECILTATGIDYAGKTNVTASGKNCLPWKNISEKMEHEGNYCRNPDSSESPWCYVQGNTKHVKEKCTIPSCAESPCFQNPCKNHGKCTVNDTSFTCTCLNGFKGDNCEIFDSIEEADCKRTTTGWEYSGKIGITKSGRTCQAWGSQTPHAHTYGTNLPENYCRDPSDSGYLWCYTTDPYKEWEECNIPNCATPPLECIPDSDPQGKLYFGTYNVTQFGYPCQRWDSQTPNEHSQSALRDQENYCRNPDNKAMPWCYTTNPNRAWLFCIIRDC